MAGQVSLCCRLTVEYVVTDKETAYLSLKQGITEELHFCHGWTKNTYTEKF